MVNPFMNPGFLFNPIFKKVMSIANCRFVPQLPETNTEFGRIKKITYGIPHPQARFTIINLQILRNLISSLHWIVYLCAISSFFNNIFTINRRKELLFILQLVFFFHFLFTEQFPPSLLLLHLQGNPCTQQTDYK